uniref:RFX-type winged-helix domain-containing protein n=1 Tax=Mesocestoides corti TaxID=53468 RepID=A0A5K3F357_MESCO
HGGSIVGAASGGATHAQIVTHQGTTYILQSGTGALEEDTTALSHTAKASPITVQWLVDNYETAEGVSLPRSTLYFHYLQHCHENKLEPMNPASFGKLIRSVFLGLRTRRLGTRGNSKYHYYGIRIKPSSQLNHYVEDSSFTLRHYPNYHRQSLEAVAEWKNLAVTGKSSAATGAVRQGGHTSTFSTSAAAAANNNAASAAGASTFGDDRSGVGSTRTSITGGGGGTQSKHQHAQFLGEATSALPNLNEICRSAGLPMPGSDDVELSPRVRNPSGSSSSGEKPSPIGASKKASAGLDGLPAKDLIKFAILYAQSAGNMLDAVVNLDFSSIAGAWKAFWRTGDPQEDSVFEKTLSKERLYALSKNIVVHQFIRLYDHTFYQSLAEVLIPNVLRPIPPTLTQAIRNFAKHLEVWMREALHDLDPVLLRIKLSAVSALAQTLRRYTSLNHLAQAARAVLKNPSQINQMLIDLSRVDFNNVQEQASWVCQCSDATVAHLEQDFKYILQKQSSLEEWAQWLDTVVSGILRPLEGNNLAYTRAAHQLVLKWSFYSSMVIRDLTLRSAASFGSFHLIRLLYDEYIFYLVEHKVAAHLGMTPVAVMGEMGRSVTRPHCSLSRTTAAALVAPATNNSSAAESRRSRHDSVTSTKGKLETVLTAAKVPEEEETAAAAAAEEAVCEVFESEAVFPLLATSRRSDGEEDEVDEYLEDEEEPDDASMSDENAMLCRAHESALLKAAEAAAERPTDQTATVTNGSTTGDDLPPPKGDEEEEEEAAIVEEAEEEESTKDQTQECCDSPPPIVTHATPMRKVVRVTTFDEGKPPVLVTEQMQTPEGVTATAAMSLIIPSEAKRARLS